MPNLQTKKAVRESEAEKGSVLQPSGKKKKKRKEKKEICPAFSLDFDLRVHWKC